MNTIKAFFKEKGLYLFCLALVFAATITGIWAIRSVVRNVADLTRSKLGATEEENVWNQPDALANDPVTDLPVQTPAPASTPSAQSSAGESSSGASPAAGAAPGAAAPGSASSAPQAALPAVSAPVEGGELRVPFSGEELVYHATLGDWRTHNGADYAAAAGAAVYALQGGTVARVADDALWGCVVEVAGDGDECWRYCGLASADVQPGQTVAAGARLGTLGTPPAEADGGAHLHLERLHGGEYLDPAA